MKLATAFVEIRASGQATLRADVAKAAEGAGRDSGKKAGDEIAKGVQAGAKKGGQALKVELGSATEQTVAKVQSQLRGLIIAGTFAAGLKKATDAASDLEQAVGGTAAVFGESKSIIDDFAKTSAKSFGISKQAAREATSQMGGLLKGFGFTNQAAAETSVTLTKLGADLAATFGGAPEEAVQALTAALRGETDPIERYGIALNQAQVNLKAVELGLSATASAVTPAAKAQASLALIYERSADAQGQFAREAGTAAGAQSIAAAKAQDAAASLGKNFLPVYERITTVVGGLAEAFGNLPGFVQTGIVALGGIAVLAGPISNLVSLGKSFVDAGSNMSKTLGGLNSAAGAASGALLGIGAAFAIASLAAQTFGDVAERARKASQEGQEQFKGYRDAINALGSDRSAIDTLIGTTLAADGFSGSLNTLGVSVGAVSSAIRGSEADFTQVMNSFDQTSDAGERLAEFLGDQRIAYQNAANDAVRFALANEKVGAAGLKSAAASSQNAAAQKKLAAAIEDGNIAYAELDGIDVPGLLAELTSRFGGAAVGAATAGSAVAAAGKDAEDAAVGFIDLANAINAAFDARLGSERADLNLASANAALAEAQAAVAGTGQAAAGGTSAAGESALDAERKVRAYEEALRGVDDAQRGVSDAQRAVEDANQQVVDSQAAVIEAERGVAEASRDIVDAQREVTEAQAGAVQASKSLTDAQTELRQVLSGYGRDSREAADAQEALSDAQLANRRASLGVADAQDKLAEAQQGLAAAQRAGDPKKLTEAFRSLQKAQLDFEESQDRQADTSAKVADSQQELTDAIDGVPASSKKASDAQNKVTAAQKALDEANRDVAESIDAVTERQRSLADAERGVIDSKREVEDAVRDLDDANRGVVDALQAVEDANFRVREAEDARTSKLGSGGGGRAVRDQAALERDLADRLLDVETAQRGVADAAADVTRKNIDQAAALAGIVIPEQINSSLAAETQRNKLLEVAATLAPGDPLRKNLEDYAAELDAVPDAIESTVDFNSSQAAGKLAALANALAAMLQATPSLQPELGPLIDSIRAQLDTLREPFRDPRVRGPRAHFGPVYPDSLHRVVEQGPELLEMSGKTYLMTGAHGGKVVSADGGGGTSVATTVHLEIHGDVYGVSNLQQAIGDALNRHDRELLATIRAGVR